MNCSSAQDRLAHSNEFLILILNRDSAVSRTFSSAAFTLLNFNGDFQFFRKKFSTVLSGRFSCIQNQAPAPVYFKMLFFSMFCAVCIGK
jgi:hypothetical protein